MDWREAAFFRNQSAGGRISILENYLRMQFYRSPFVAAYGPNVLLLACVTPQRSQRTIVEYASKRRNTNSTIKQFRRRADADHLA